MNIAYTYRLYPTKEQSVLLEKTFGCCRLVWNMMLHDKKVHYKQTKKTLYPTPAQYKQHYPFFQKVDSLALANVQLNLNNAFSNFFEKHTGYPKFKSKKKSKKSYTTNNQSGTIAIGKNFIKLPKRGSIKAIIHRKPPKEYKLKSYNYFSKTRW